MAGNNKNSVAGTQSKIDPGIISQMQNYARIREQLPKQAIMASNTKYIGSIPKSPSSNFNLNQIYNAIQKSVAYNRIQKYAAPGNLAYEKGFEFVASKNVIYQLTKLKKLAQKYGNLKLEGKVDKLIEKLPKSVKKRLDFRMAEIEEIAKTGKPNLSKEFKNVKKAYEKFGSQIINGVNKANTVKKIQKLKNVAKGLKVVEKVGKGFFVGLDIINLWDFRNKLLQKKATGGEWVDAVISALSLTGNLLGGIGFVASMLGGSALAVSLAPVIATIGTVALVAGLAKFGYDTLLSDEALKKAPKGPKKKLIVPNQMDISKLFGFDASQYIYNNARQSIPRNARGTSYFPGGLSLVGEEGPELVNLPRGSQVFSNSRTQSLLKGMGSGSAGISVNYSPQITIQGNADAHVMKIASDNSYADFERKFNALMDRRRRLSFAGG